MASLQELEQQLKVEEERRVKLQKLLDKKRGEEKESKLTKAQERTVGNSEKERLRDVFNIFDKDKSGAIEAAELSAISKELNCELSAEEIARTMTALDTNSDGKLNFQEFVKWWSSDRVLGGNEGVKLKLLRGRLVGRMAKNDTLQRLKTMTATEITDRIIDLACTVNVGRLPEEWAPAVEMHWTCLPLSKEAFTFEGKKIIQQMQSVGACTARADYWESGDEDTRLSGVPIASVLKVHCKLRDNITRERADELVANYMKYCEDNADVFCDADKEPLLPAVYVAERGGVLGIDVVLMMRRAKALKQLVEAVDEAMKLEGENESVSAYPEKVFESIACSIKSNMDPMEWLRDEDARPSQLLNMLQVSTKCSVSKSLIDVLQKGVFSEEVDSGFYTSSFRESVAMMIAVALAGTSSMKLQFKSPTDVLHRVAESFAVLHKDSINRGIEERAVKESSKLARLLSSTAIEDHWLEAVTQMTYSYTTKELLQYWRMAIGGEVVKHDDATEAVFTPLHEAVQCPTRVQLICPFGSVVGHLKGLDVITANIPSSAEQGEQWLEEGEKILTEFIEKREEEDLSMESFGISKLESSLDIKKQPARRLVVAGMKGCGKTSIVHRMVTGLGVADPPPTTQLEVSTVMYKGTRYPVWEYWDAANNYAALPDFMLSTDLRFELITLVWVIDGTKGLQAGERKAFQNLLGRMDSDDLHVVVAMGKSDIANAKLETLRKELVDRDIWQEMGKRRGSAAVTSTDVDTVQHLLSVVRDIERNTKEVPETSDSSDESSDSDLERF